MLLFSRIFKKKPEKKFREPAKCSQSAAGPDAEHSFYRIELLAAIPKTFIMGPP
jgi:hypothetical protein